MYTFDYNLCPAGTGLCPVIDPTTSELITGHSPAPAGTLRRQRGSGLSPHRHLFIGDPSANNCVLIQSSTPVIN